jgi:membrane protein
LLFATAWAATSNPDLLPAAPNEAPPEEAPPEPAPDKVPQAAVPAPRAAPVDGLKARQALTAAAVGGLAALGLSRLVRRDTDE